jgi:hypothetical protein
MLLIGRIKTGLGKWARALYYLALIWALLWTGVGTSATLAKITAESVSLAITLIIIVGILPALGCYFLAIRADRWRVSIVTTPEYRQRHAA